MTMRNSSSSSHNKWDVKIIGTGSYLPGEAITNQELIDRFNLNTSDEWIKNNIGIQSRHWAPDGIATSDLGAKAALKALKSASINAYQLDRIILCSSSSDWPSPAAASNIQRIIGAQCPVEDKQVACAGFIFGMDHGARLIATGLKYVMVIGADVKSRFLNHSDYRLMPIFADGAGAVILTSHSDTGGLLGCELWSDGRKLQNLITPAGGSAMPASFETVRNGLHNVTMQVDGSVIFEDAVEAMTRLGNLVCQKAGMNANDVDLLIPHQANKRILLKVAQNLRVSLDKTVMTINHTANIVNGTIPYALDYAILNRIAQPGKIILMVTAGAGYSAGAVLYQMPE